MVIESSSSNARVELFKAVARQRNNDRNRRGHVSLQPARHLMAADVGQANVKDDDLGSDARGLLECRLAAERKRNGMPIHFVEHLHGFGSIPVVVDEQDTAAHAAARLDRRAHHGEWCVSCGKNDDELAAPGNAVAADRHGSAMQFNKAAHDRKTDPQADMVSRHRPLVLREKVEHRVDEIGSNAGASTRQRSNAFGHRGWKWQPGGGASGEGISPRIGT